MGGVLSFAGEGQEANQAGRPRVGATSLDGFIIVLEAGCKGCRLDTESR